MDNGLLRQAGSEASQEPWIMQGDVLSKSDAPTAIDGLQIFDGQRSNVRGEPGVEDLLHGRILPIGLIAVQRDAHRPASVYEGIEVDALRLARVPNSLDDLAVQRNIPVFRAVQGRDLPVDVRA